MTRSERRKPAASSRSRPGVRMMTAKDRPCRRTSSGSSVAAKSIVPLTCSPLTRVTDTRRAGARLSPGRSGSDMIAEHQLARMRLQVRLVGKIRDGVRAHVMAKQRQWHNERDELAAIVVDAREQFLLRRRVDDFLQVPRHV